MFHLLIKQRKNKFTFIFVT